MAQTKDDKLKEEICRLIHYMGVVPALDEIIKKAREGYVNEEERASNAEVNKLVKKIEELQKEKEDFIEQKCREISPKETDYDLETLSVIEKTLKDIVNQWSGVLDSKYNIVDKFKDMLNQRAKEIIKG